MSNGFSFPHGLVLQEFLNDWAKTIRRQLDVQNLTTSDWMILQVSLAAAIRALGDSADWIDLEDYEGDLGWLIDDATRDLQSWIQTH
jgi:hypothetical protein